MKLIESCPLDETKLAALDWHDDIKELAETHYNPFVVPVLMFPDMEPDPAIKELAKRNGVYLVWRTDDLIADLTGIVRSRGRSNTLTMDRIVREVWAVTDGLIRVGRSGEETRRDAARRGTFSVSVGGFSVLQGSAGFAHPADECRRPRGAPKGE